MKIVIIGTSGCGKTTLGHRISSQLAIPFVDLDNLYWLPEWVIRDPDEFLESIDKVTAQENWILCGNYSSSIDRIWPKANLLIWLDYPLRILLWRSLKRSVRRFIYKEPCCNGNYETLSRFFSSNSIIWWILSTYKKRKDRYGEFFASHSLKLKLVHLKSQTETDEFLATLSQRR